MNRPDKRNAMNPVMNREMNEVLDALEVDDRCRVLVLTGSGESFSAGMDLKEYFRETDDAPRIVQTRARRDAFAWQGQKLMNFVKPTIAMVNGWCFGGAITPMASCDLAIAADEAMFGVSEINWGILPGGNVSKVLSQLVGRRAALYAIMTGIPFNGTKAAAIGLVNEFGAAARSCATGRGSWRRSCSRRTRPCCTRPRSPSGTSRTCPGTWRSTTSARRTSRAS